MSYGVSYELWGMAQIQKKIKEEEKDDDQEDFRSF